MGLRQDLMIVQHRQRLKLVLYAFHVYTLQGWAQDVGLKARDRDAHLPKPRRWLQQPRRDRIETLKFRDETETRRL